MTTPYTGVVPTYYQGIQYRSRTEARWSIFFSEMKLLPLYEPRRFRIPDYLPDFHLIALGAWIEIKPTTDHARPAIETISTLAEYISERHLAANSLSERDSAWLIIGSPIVTVTKRNKGIDYRYIMIKPGGEPHRFAQCPGCLTVSISPCNDVQMCRSCRNAAMDHYTLNLRWAYRRATRETFRKVVR